MADDGKNQKAHFTCIWKIKNLLSFPCLGEIRSPVFTADSLEGTRWQLVLSRLHSFFEVLRTIRRVEEDDGPDSIEIEYEMSFLTCNGKELMAETKPNLPGEPRLTTTCFLDEHQGLGINIDRDSTTSDQAIGCKWSILDADGLVVYSQNIADLILTGQKRISSHRGFHNKKKLISKKKSLLPNDVLYLKCELEMMPREPGCRRMECYKH
ncbi:speckle-type POZ protein [Caerostris darwini]|uniref:Speckle-type POZ protein n=1 Tax=Caerostris darwini TaxID=1538125 RepID=A0AAV4UDW2_9ARAC|nr:speckle-type POZ protein [Caerostris darwini]